MEQYSKELPFFRHHKRRKWPNYHIYLNHKPTETQQYLHFKSHQNCVKFIPYTLAHRIYPEMTDKNRRKTCLKELRTALNQTGYATALINKLATIVEGDPKAPFSIATTPRCRGGRYSIPWIAPLYPWTVPYNAEC